MTYPYTTTVQGLNDVIRQLRANFPSQVTTDTLKKWNIASNNEGVVIGVLRFLGILDEENKKQNDPAKVFVEHDDKLFAEKFSILVKQSYNELFDLWGEEAWTLDKSKLIQFFRSNDETSSRTGEQQARTFQALAMLSGYSNIDTKNTSPKKTMSPRPTSTRQNPRKKNDQNNRSESTPPINKDSSSQTPKNPNFALTVRVEINLPVSDNQEVYDKIFRSIKDNLLNE